VLVSISVADQDEIYFMTDGDGEVQMLPILAGLDNHCRSDRTELLGKCCLAPSALGIKDKISPPLKMFSVREWAVRRPWFAESADYYTVIEKPANLRSTPELSIAQGRL
jgi:hypothetical protein